MSEISKSIQFICDEKGLDYNVVLEAVEAALGAAYRKDFGSRLGNYRVEFDVETGDMKVWDVKNVIEDVEESVLEAAQEEMQKRREKALEEGRELTEEEVADLPRFNPKTEIMLSQAKEYKKTVKVGETLEMAQEVPGDFGRMAAQTAKQVIIQKLREAERQTVFDDFKNQEGKIVQGTVQRRDRTGMVIVDLGKITGILSVNEQIAREQYRPGARMRFYVIAVALGMRGPEIVLSRAHKNMVSVIFEQEIPEIATGDVVIRTIARDPGNRSKVAVSTDDQSIDPIGSCIGQRGSRINTIIQELGGEKIDIIEYKENQNEFIKMALSPAKISRVELDEKEKKATAYVVPDQFSLAIGRGGQNVRLAAELTGWGINVVEEGNEEKVVSDSDDPAKVEATLETE
jgi:N utilization substance protein A